MNWNPNYKPQFEKQPCGYSHEVCQDCCERCSNVGKFCKLHKPIEEIISDEPYVGWRLFGLNKILDDEANNRYLTGLAHTQFEWAPGVNVSQCSIGHGYWNSEKEFFFKEDTRVAEHMKRCSCGFYSFNTSRMPDLITPILMGQFVVLGEIQIWGSIVKHRDGWRSQYAKIKNIYLSNDYILTNDVSSRDDLAETYSCPVGLISKWVGVNTIIRNKPRYIKDVHMIGLKDYYNPGVRGRFMPGVLDAYFEHQYNGDLKLNILIP